MPSAIICAVCGGESFTDRAVLWPELIAEWQLSPAEVAYINRQQGTICAGCGSNLRSIALAQALLTENGWAAPLAAALQSPQARTLRVLEINEAGTLSPRLAKMPGHVLAVYPAVDMHALPYPDASFDIVIHSDTLEHVPNPAHGLAECRRVLAPGGVLLFTVPQIIGRLTRSRQGLALSFHGNPQTSSADFAVQTEFGADAWTCAAQAGFSQITLHVWEFPAAIAFACRA